MRSRPRSPTRWRAATPARTAATLAAIAQGDAPAPELEVARIPRSGTAVTHRVLLLWSGAIGWPCRRDADGAGRADAQRLGRQAARRFQQGALHGRARRRRWGGARDARVEAERALACAARRRLRRAGDRQRPVGATRRRATSKRASSTGRSGFGWALHRERGGASSTRVRPISRAASSRSSMCWSRRAPPAACSRPRAARRRRISRRRRGPRRARSISRSWRRAWSRPRRRFALRATRLPHSCRRPARQRERRCASHGDPGARGFRLRVDGAERPLAADDSGGARRAVTASKQSAGGMQQAHRPDAGASRRTGCDRSAGAARAA